MATPHGPLVPFAHRDTFRVTYHDLDVLNHLNHATYFVYMETLRCRYYLTTVGNLDPQKLDIIIAEASCRYLAPATYDTEMIGEIAPARPLGTTSFALLYRFRDEEAKTIYARGRTVVVSYDYARGTKKPIAPDRRAMLERDAVDASLEGW
ncbi:MAG: thioesterase family protein [Thermoplasmata archaeon]